MTQEFNQLLKQFGELRLNRGSFVASFNQFLRAHPNADQASLTQQIKLAKKQGWLNVDQSKFLLDTIKMSFDSVQGKAGEHTIVPTEIADPTLLTGAATEDSTLIFDSDSQETEISHTHYAPDENAAASHAGSAGSSAKAASATATATNDANEQAENELTIGSVIKGRFVLTELLGRGGMGVVYKARDLVKVQAQDSNPYVAVKVLTDAFKHHSSSFIALQREASKAQRLAHPNIATVFDFDHDAGAVYMTMELMVGQNLQKLIKELPKEGLPKDIAFNYIRQLADGLAYAHKRQLIHCDLKPANIFLTQDGTIKLLDFGITRAIKRKTEGIDDDTTIFDPKVLKALTPAYASIEMFSGEDPDPRDDLYALGCVAYELLTGHHPYKKVPAHKAKELNLKPAPIKKINRKEFAALQNLLHLERKNRTPSIDNFTAELDKPKSYLKEISIASAAVLLIGLSFLAQPLLSQQKEDRDLAVIQNVQNGNQAALIALLADLPNMDFNTKISLTSILRKEIIQYYQTRINAAIDASNQSYNFPEAFKLLNEVKQLYPDSASLTEAHKSLTANRDRLVAALESKHSELRGNTDDINRILMILQEADPYHALLR